MEFVDNSVFTAKGPIEDSDLFPGKDMLKGTLRFNRVSERAAGIVRDNRGTESGDTWLVYAGRSTHSQVGVHEVLDLRHAEFIKLKQAIDVPATLHGLRPEPWLDTILRKQHTKCGRLFLLPKTERLKDDEIMQAWKKDRTLALPDGTVVADDLIKVPIEARLEYVLDPARLNKSDRAYILDHGRSALTGYQELLKHKKAIELKLHELFVGAMRMSTGPHVAVIIKKIREHLEHLEAVVLDALRSTGIVNDARQVEMVLSGSNGDDQTRKDDQKILASDANISCAIFRPEPEAARVFGGASLQTRERIHNEGTHISDLFPMDIETVEKWFASISTHPDEGGNAAVIVTTHGATPVPWSQHYKSHKKNINRAVERGKRLNIAEYKPLEEALDRTSKNGRLYLGHHLPSESHLEHLAENGVRTFISRAMNLPKNIFDGEREEKPFSNFFLDSAKHARLIELEKQGCEFIWLPQSQRGNKISSEKVRQFYKGFFVDPSQKDRFDSFRKGGTGIAMFGASVQCMERDERKLDSFMAGLNGIFKKFGDVAILEGSGPSLMALSRKAARKNGMLNVSFGMDFEQIGEIPNFDSEALVHFQNDQIEYRQTVFQKHQMIPILMPGGKGTSFEYLLAFLKEGLGASLPNPILLVDPREGEDEHYYKHFIKQLEVITSDHRTHKALCQPWLRNIVHQVGSFDEALEVIQRFTDDPMEYWKNAKVPPAHLRKAYDQHLELCTKMQIQLPDYLLSALEKIGEQTYGMAL